MWLSVTKTSEGTHGLINLPINEVLFLEFDPSKKCIFVHSRTDQYYLAGTLAYWAKSLESYNFEKVDRNIVVQISKIQRLDSHFCLAFFEKEICSHSKRVTMSQKYFKRILDGMQQSDERIVVV